MICSPYTAVVTDCDNKTKTATTLFLYVSPEDKKRTLQYQTVLYKNEPEGTYFNLFFILNWYTNHVW